MLHSIYSSQVISLNPCFNGRYSLSTNVAPSDAVIDCLNPCFNGRYSLSRTSPVCKERQGTVLILVLMEDTHWVLWRAKRLCLIVLILVLMEDTHWDASGFCNAWKLIRLNPCFNGRYSLSTQRIHTDWGRQSLNPCFNGRYSLRTSLSRICWWRPVLILVLMEDTHWVKKNSGRRSKKRLNPCFNGRYSLRINF